MSIERNDGNILKNLKGKVKAITYTSSEGWGNQWITIDDIKYATWINFDQMDLFPGTIVEHSPYIEISHKPHKIKATKILAVMKKK